MYVIVILNLIISSIIKKKNVLKLLILKLPEWENIPIKNYNSWLKLEYLAIEHLKYLIRYMIKEWMFGRWVLLHICYLRNACRLQLSMNNNSLRRLYMMNLIMKVYLYGRSNFYKDSYASSQKNEQQPHKHFLPHFYS